MSPQEQAERQAFECEMDADPAPISNINSLIRMSRIKLFEELMAHRYHCKSQQSP